MDGTKTLKYDVICSLGGNCSVAHNLLYRKKRPFSLPFDWVYMEDESPLIYLQEGFKNNFKNLALKTNLKKLPATSEHQVIYYDSYSGYYFPNHFTTSLDEHDSFPSFYKTLHRRTDRLIHLLNTGKSALFILTCTFNPSSACLLTLHETLVRLFPHCHISFKIMIFGDKNPFSISQLSKDIQICYISRPFNEYDFYHTNYDAWHFMDDIEWNLHTNNKETSLSHQLFSIHFFSYKLRLLLQKRPTK